MINQTDKRVALITGVTGQNSAYLADTVPKVVVYQDGFVQDTSKSKGSICKIMGASKIRNIGWSPQINLANGMAMAFTDYLGRNYR